MVLVEPEKRVRDQVVYDLVAPVVEDQRPPVRVRALTGIGVFVQMRAVEFGESKRVAREMGRCPVKNHAEARAMAPVNELHEFVRRSVAAGRSVVADGLVAP